MVDSNMSMQPIYSEATQTCEPAPYFSPAVLASEENASASTVNFSSEDRFIQPENQIRKPNTLIAPVKTANTVARHHRDYADFFTDFNIPWYESVGAGAALPFMAIAALFGCEPEDESSSEPNYGSPNQECTVYVNNDEVSCYGDLDGDGVSNQDDNCPIEEGYGRQGCPEEDGSFPSPDFEPMPQPTPNDAAVMEPDVMHVDPCDKDGDGYRSPECNGDDCNDRVDTFHPNAHDMYPSDGDQDCDGTDGPYVRTVNCTSQADVPTLARAIAEAPGGDESENSRIVVCGGVHQGPFRINKRLTIEGEGDVTLRGNGACSHIVEGNEGNFSIGLINLKFRDGQVYLRNSSATIYNGDFQGQQVNQDDCMGSLVYHSPNINDDSFHELAINVSTIQNNECGLSCIYGAGTAVILRNDQIVNNSAGELGIMFSALHFEIVDTTIADNRGSDNAVIFNFSPGAYSTLSRIENSEITGNSAPQSVIRVATRGFSVHGSRIQNNQATGRPGIALSGGVYVEGRDTTFLSQDSQWGNQPHDVVGGSGAETYYRFDWNGENQFSCSTEEGRCD